MTMTTTIKMSGEVIPNEYAEIYDLFGYDYFDPAQVDEMLQKANGDDVTLEINSPGGYVATGSEIYTTLKKYSGKINAEIVGQACSAASWIALAADKVVMSPTAQMMIHRASTGAQGNSDDIASALQSIDSMDQALVDLYSQRTGKDKQDVYQMMCKETWLNAKEAVKNGFADEIMFQNEEQSALVNADGSVRLNPEMINKIKNVIHQQKMTDDVTKPTQSNTNIEDKGQSNEDLSLLLWR